MREVCCLLGIDKLRTTAYKPSTNSGIERFHRTLNSMIGKMIDRDQRDWDSALPYVMAAYRSSRNEGTGYTPNNLMLGREVRTPMDIVFATQLEAAPRLYSDNADELEERLKLAYSDVWRHLGVAATRNK